MLEQTLLFAFGVFAFILAKIEKIRIFRMILGIIGMFTLMFAGFTFEEPLLKIVLIFFSSVVGIFTVLSAWR